MRPYRNERIASLINQELSKLFLKEFDFGDTLLTVTSVVVSQDLSLAKIKVAILPYEKELEVWKEIEKEEKNIEKKLARILNIKPMPHLKFFIERYDEKDEEDEKEVKEE
jgi:ribosome-binding factor A